MQSNDARLRESDTRHLHDLEVARAGKAALRQPITNALSLLPSGSRK
jgi:hypothetical protein